VSAVVRGVGDGLRFLERLGVVGGVVVMRLQRVG
jgi:hypothetical protein